MIRYLWEGLYLILSILNVYEDEIESGKPLEVVMIEVTQEANMFVPVSKSGQGTDDT